MSEKRFEIVRRFGVVGKIYDNKRDFLLDLNDATNMLNLQHKRIKELEEQFEKWCKE